MTDFLRSLLQRHMAAPAPPGAVRPRLPARFEAPEAGAESLPPGEAEVAGQGSGVDGAAGAADLAATGEPPRLSSWDEAARPASDRDSGVAPGVAGLETIRPDAPIQPRPVAPSLKLPGEPAPTGPAGNRGGATDATGGPRPAPTGGAPATPEPATVRGDSPDPEAVAGEAALDRAPARGRDPAIRPAPAPDAEDERESADTAAPGAAEGDSEGRQPSSSRVREVRPVGVALEGLRGAGSTAPPGPASAPTGPANGPLPEPTVTPAAPPAHPRGSGLAAHPAGEDGSGGEPDVVRVTIGRVEVLARKPERPPSPALPPAPRTPPLSLADYLQQRSEGRR